MEDQIRQITEKKVTEQEATLVLAFALLEVLKRQKALEKEFDELQKMTSDIPIIKRLVFGAVGIILTLVFGALIALVVTHR